MEDKKEMFLTWTNAGRVGY